MIWIRIKYLKFIISINQYSGILLLLLIVNHSLAQSIECKENSVRNQVRDKIIELKIMDGHHPIVDVLVSSLVDSVWTPPAISDIQGELGIGLDLNQQIDSLQITHPDYLLLKFKPELSTGNHLNCVIELRKKEN